MGPSQPLVSLPDVEPLVSPEVLPLVSLVSSSVAFPPPVSVISQPPSIQAVARIAKVQVRSAGWVVSFLWVKVEGVMGVCP